MNSQNSLKYHIKTRVFLNNPDFGPGVSRIMELVKETGRLSEAYKIMGLSSSKGWKIIKKAEEDLGFPLFISIAGGKGGGKTELSKEGENFLEKYQAFVAELNLEAEKLFNKHFND